MSTPLPSSRLPALDSTIPTPAAALVPSVPSVPSSIAPALTWLQQHRTAHDLTLADLGKALDFDASTISRILDGSYKGSWDNVATAIARYRAIVEDSGSIQRGEYTRNRYTRAIAAGLRYAVANKSIVTILGDSGLGKTAGVAHWRTTEFRGQSVRVVAPPSGKHPALVRRILEAIGHDSRCSVQRAEAIITAHFTRDMLLIIDHAHRLLPAGKSEVPTSIEFLIDLTDETQLPIVLISTQRFMSQLQNLRYQCEQFIRRIGLPIALPGRVTPRDIAGIVRQYIPSPTDQFLDLCTEIANGPGRIGILCETLKIASRIAAKQNARAVTQAHFTSAHDIRRRMMSATLDDEPSVSSAPSVPSPEPR